MSGGSTWLPLMHARTAVLDFRPRLFARPHWFSDAQIDAARKFILSTTRDANSLWATAPNGPDGLVHRPRWSQFSGPGFRVFGVTADSRWFSPNYRYAFSSLEDLDAKSVGSPLYAFVGFAAPTDAPALAAPVRDSQLMRDVYEALMQPRYRETRSTPTWEEATVTGPGGATLPAPAFEATSSEPHRPSAALKDQFEYRPSRQEDNDGLWRAVAANGRISLLLDAPAVEHIRDTAFDVVTSTSASASAAVARKRPPPREPQVSQSARRGAKSDREILERHKHKRPIEKKKQAGGTLVVATLAICGILLIAAAAVFLSRR